jgi:hypothetical protein
MKKGGKEKMYSRRKMIRTQTWVIPTCVAVEGQSRIQALGHCNRTKDKYERPGEERI